MKAVFRAFCSLLLALFTLGAINIIFIENSFAKENQDCISNYGFCPNELKILSQKPKEKSVLPSINFIKNESAKEEEAHNKKVYRPLNPNYYPQNLTSSLNPDVILNLINIYRKKIGLTPFEKEENLCKIAKDRGPEINKEIFVTGNLHQGIRERDFPYFVTENLIYQDNEQNALNWWLNSPIHRRAIEGNSKYSCGECFGLVCSQLFTSYVPKTKSLN